MTTDHGPQRQPASEAESLAKLFHETYERLAPQFGYETRKASAVSWDQVPEQNKALMIAVCGEIGSELARLRAENERLRRCVEQYVAEQNCDESWIQILKAKLRKTIVDAKRRRTEVCRLRQALKEYADIANWDYLPSRDSIWIGPGDKPEQLAADALRGEGGQES